MTNRQSILVKALHNPDCYDHPADRVKLVETHISWVLLAGNFAYKLKKPVNFGFLDFSTLAKRRHYCNEEIRLNQRFAPHLYLEVIGIGGTPEAPILSGTPAFEYAVKMKRFPRSGELDVMLEQQRLKAEQIRAFADYIAAIHQQLPRSEPNQSFGSAAAISAPVLENFHHLQALKTYSRSAAQLNELESWSRSRLKTLSPRMEQRKAQGAIRECHGDMHLANMVWQDQQPLLFDCIEFNENLRWIDVISDIAFLLMDLDDRGASPLGWLFLNRYLRQSGDYQGLPLLNFYKTYRALVRAKVTCLRLSQPGLSSRERTVDSELAQSYLDLATSYTVPQQPPLIISHGFSGSGKSTFIEQLAPLCGAISLHSDIERKRLHGLQATETSHSALDSGIYTEQASRQTYHHLQTQAETILLSDLPVIVDATFLKQEQRRQMQQLASKLQRPLLILDFPLSKEDLIRRVEQRSSQRRQVSEADVAVLNTQWQQAEPLTAEETQRYISVHPHSTPEQIAALIKQG